MPSRQWISQSPGGAHHASQSPLWHLVSACASCSWDIANPAQCQGHSNAGIGILQKAVKSATSYMNKRCGNTETLDVAGLSICRYWKGYICGVQG